MRLLLDTHAFIWWDTDGSKLSIQAREACASSSNSIHLSIASIWEMQIKQMLGKLKLRSPVTALVESQQSLNGLIIEPITLDDVAWLDRLPPIHRDPFDRMIAAQGLRGDFSVVTVDDDVRAYGVKVVW
jgi:PIN domain nuclease of toxin-antitoxin system